MLFAVVSKDKKKKSELEEKLESHGFTKGQKPEFVFVYGGDGSVVYSERLYPGIPKIPIRGSKTSKKRFYEEKDLEKILDQIKKNNYRLEKYSKLEAEFRGRKLIALNEIQVHNLHPFEAVRFTLDVAPGKRYENIIGDGALVSTPFGSTGYYYSLGGKPFKKGIGIAFNNPHNPIDSFTADDRSTVEITIDRSEAYLVCDNDPDMPVMSKGDTVRIKKSTGYAQFMIFDSI